MGEAQVRLMVFFDEPFWVGVFERYENGQLTVAKHTFGSEPREYEVFEFILEHYYSLEFSPAVAAAVKEAHRNPKRMQRDIRKALGNTGTGTKSQQALKLQQEQNKLERKGKSREQKLAEDERKFILKQQKKKERHRGR